VDYRSTQNPLPETFPNVIQSLGILLGRVVRQLTKAFLLFGCSLAAVGNLATGARSDNIVIAGGQTASAQYLLKLGEILNVEKGGTVIDSYAVDSANYNQTINNAGEIYGGVIALTSYSNLILNNTGVIAGQFYAIENEGAGARLNNMGRIGGYLGGHFGGSSGLSGIINDAADYTVDNSGAIYGTNFGIVNLGRGLTVHNSGTMNAGQAAILSFEDDLTVVNSGTLKGSLAVEFLGSRNNLELLPGSNIQGAILFNDATNNLLIDPGLNTALRVYQGTVRTNGAPFVIKSNTVYVVDTTGFALQTRAAGELAHLVSSEIDTRLHALDNLGAGPTATIEHTLVHAASGGPHEKGSFWISGLAQANSGAGTFNTAAFASLTGGFLLGADEALGGQRRLGAFAGYSTGRAETAADLQDLETGKVVGGFYLGQTMGSSFANLSLTGAFGSVSSARHILNNMVPGGIETANAQYSDWLFSPAATFGTRISLTGGTLTPSIKLQYAGLHTDGYSETGSSANLIVASRLASIFNARADLAFAPNPSKYEPSPWSPVLHVGLEGTAADAPIDASLGGSPLSFSGAGDAALRGYVGVEAAYAFSNNGSIKLDSEVGYDTARVISCHAKASLQWSF